MTTLGPSSSFTDLSHLLKASGDPLRLEILRALAKGSFGVLELCHLFETKQSGMSHHLKVLSKAHLVSTRKEGNSIFYRRAAIGSDDPHAELKISLLKSLDQCELSPEVAHRLNEVYMQRSEASQNFFSENAGRFQKQQDLIAAFDVYGAHVEEVVKNAVYPSREVALEIGPGAGEFLSFLCKQFTHVTALDNSEQMLSVAKHHCLDLGLTNIDFVLNDTLHCHNIPGSVDCAIINMVLHHTPAPQQIFSDVAHALKDNGVVIICDLSQHNQDWTRDACGDVWLGFAPDELSEWALQNRLYEGQSSYFALRNGFQIQIREFIKKL